MQKPYRIEAQQAVKRLKEMAGEGSPAVQMVLPMAEKGVVKWIILETAVVSLSRG